MRGEGGVRAWMNGCWLEWLLHHPSNSLPSSTRQWPEPHPVPATNVHGLPKLPVAGRDTSQPDLCHATPTSQEDCTAAAHREGVVRNVGVGEEGGRRAGEREEEGFICLSRLERCMG